MMKRIYLIIILILPINLYAADIASEVQERIGYSWPNTTEYISGWLLIKLTGTGFTKDIYKNILLYGVCILENKQPNLLEGTVKIVVEGKYGKHFAFNGGAEECQQIIKMKENRDAYIESKTQK